MTDTQNKMDLELLGKPPLDQTVVANVLAEHGERANREELSHHSRLKSRYPDAHVFNLAVARWMAQIFPVPNGNRVYQSLLSYLDVEQESPKGIIDEFLAVPLFVQAATLWRIILLTQDASSIEDDYSASDIWLYQEIVLNAAGLLAVDKIPKGIGPSLFLGPFRILAAWRPDHWNSMETQLLLYPVGKSEVAAFAYLDEKGACWLGDNLERIARLKEQDFAAASATTTLAQDIQKQLASIAGVSLLHINTGLSQLGRSVPAPRENPLQLFD